MPAKLITLAGWGEVRDTIRPSAKEDAGWSRPACRAWDASGGSWDELSYWIQVKSCVPRTGSSSRDCAGSAGQGSRQGLSQDQACVPQNRQPHTPGWCGSWKLVHGQLVLWDVQSLC